MWSFIRIGVLAFAACWCFEARSAGDAEDNCRCLRWKSGRCIVQESAASCEARKAASRHGYHHPAGAVPPASGGAGGGGSGPPGEVGGLGGGKRGPVAQPISPDATSPAAGPAAVPSTPALLPAPGAQPAPPSVGSATPPALVPARSFLRSDDIPPPSIGAYGVVALRSKSTSANRQRLLMTCGAYEAYLPRQESLPGTVSISDQMVTIWPLDDPDAQEAKADDCDFVIDHYDLYGGISAIQDAERQGAKLDGVGPFLIGWSPSNSRGIPDKVVLVVDLSEFESQDSFDQAFLFWQKKIVEDPKL
jgi:hypothetical protein